MVNSRKAAIRETLNAQKNKQKQEKKILKSSGKSPRHKQIVHGSSSVIPIEVRDGGRIKKATERITKKTNFNMEDLKHIKDHLSVHSNDNDDSIKYPGRSRRRSSLYFAPLPPPPLLSQPTFTTNSNTTTIIVPETKTKSNHLADIENGHSKLKKINVPRSPGGSILPRSKWSQNQKDNLLRPIPTENVHHSKNSLVTPAPVRLVRELKRRFDFMQDSPEDESKVPYSTRNSNDHAWSTVKKHRHHPVAGSGNQEFDIDLYSSPNLHLSAELPPFKQNSETELISGEGNSGILSEAGLSERTHDDASFVQFNVDLPSPPVKLEITFPLRKDKESSRMGDETDANWFSDTKRDERRDTGSVLSFLDTNHECSDIEHDDGIERKKETDDNETIENNIKAKVGSEDMTEDSKSKEKSSMNIYEKMSEQLIPQVTFEIPQCKTEEKYHSAFLEEEEIGEEVMYQMMQKQ